MSATNVKQPVDAGGNVINRSMGVPMVQDAIILVSATTYIDLFDLTADAYKNRVFTGISVDNPDDNKSVHISFDDGDFVNDNSKNMVVGPGSMMTLDSLMFGPGIVDDSTGKKITKIRAKLSATEGTQHTATVDYSGLTMADGMTAEFGGNIYEFSNDGSLADPSSGNIIVALGASLDAAWTNLVAAINANDQRVVATIDTGTDTVTITSVAGGADADAYTLADVDTGAIFSAATLGGGSLGVTPIVHIW